MKLNKLIKITRVPTFKIPSLAQILTGVFLSSLSLNLWAGIEIIMTADGADAGDTHLLIQDGKLKVDHQSTQRGDQSQMIFDSQFSQMTMIEPNEGIYTVFNQSSLQQMKQQMDAMKQQMEAQIANLPPEQAKMMQ